MSKTTQNLEKQLAAKEKEANLLRKKIEAEKLKNKPKKIMDLVKSYEDACKYKKVKPVHVYKNNKSTDTIDEIAYKRMKFTFEVLNEGHKFKMTPNEDRYYVWFNLSPGSGFAFVNTHCGNTDACAASAARLCLKTRELAYHTGNCPSIFEDYKNFIM
jgi:hypothetical protein